MKKELLVLFLLLTTVLSYAQVGVNTETPKATLDIVKAADPTGNKPQGVLFPRIRTEERSNFKNVVVGTMIYNTDKQCLEMYLGIINGEPQWSCLPGFRGYDGQSFEVSPVKFDGFYAGGGVLSPDNKVSFKIKNNSGVPMNLNFADAVNIVNGSSNITVSDCYWSFYSDGEFKQSCFGENHVFLKPNGSAILTYNLQGITEKGNLIANFNKFNATAEQIKKVKKLDALISDKYIFLSESNNNQFEISIRYKGKGSYGELNKRINFFTKEGKEIGEYMLHIPAGKLEDYEGEIKATIEVKKENYSSIDCKMLHEVEEDIDLEGVKFKLILQYAKACSS